jgi:hypothetical protein
MGAMIYKVVFFAGAVLCFVQIFLMQGSRFYSFASISTAVTGAGFKIAHAQDSSPRDISITDGSFRSETAVYNGYM